MHLVNVYVDIWSYIVASLSCISPSWFVYCINGGAHGVVVIVVGNGHGDASSNPGRD